MDAQVEQLLIMNLSKFPAECLPTIRERLEGCNRQDAMMAMIHLKDPTTALILSIFLGHLGIDRFYIDSIGIGLGKLLTCGGLYIWWIVDIFLIMDATRKKNYEILMMYLNVP
jgi:TM2 domain-containing membrane protein YozV